MVACGAFLATATVTRWCSSHDVRSSAQSSESLAASCISSSCFIFRESAIAHSIPFSSKRANRCFAKPLQAMSFVDHVPDHAVGADSELVAIFTGRLQYSDESFELPATWAAPSRPRCHPLSRRRHRHVKTETAQKKSASLTGIRTVCASRHTVRCRACETDRWPCRHNSC